MPTTHSPAHVSPDNVHTTAISRLRSAFRSARRVGDVPAGVDPRVAAWYWAYYLALGTSDLSARESALREIRYLSADLLSTAPRTDARGAIAQYPDIADRPHHPSYTTEMAFRDIGR